MPIPSILALLSLVLTVAFVVAAALRSWKFLWAAAFCSWVLSFLALFSIGLWLLSATFVLLAVAIAAAVGRLRGPADLLIPVLVGVLAWVAAIRWIGGKWLFFPFLFIS